MADRRGLSAHDHSVGVGGNVEGDIWNVHVEGQFPSAPQSLHQIPEPTATFKGRQDELEELTAAIREGGVTISGLRGMGGVGKTELAYKLAARLAPDYPDGQLLVDMDGTSSPLAPAQAMARVIHAFYPQLELPTNANELGGIYRSTLHGKRALLLLDDAADADQVRPLIPPRTCALLVTSRRHFQLPGMYALNLDALEEEAAVELLRTIAPRIGEEAVEIAELCGCLPLALEVAAGAVAVREDLSPADYVRRLRDKQQLDRVDASLSLSYDLLSEELQGLWARLGVFTIGFERQAAAAVWEMAEDEASDRLGELLRYSLVDWKREAERYELHDLARVFAYDRLKEREDPPPVHRLAAEYFEAKLTDEDRGGKPEEALEAVDQWERAEVWEMFARRSSELVGGLGRLGYWVEVQKRLEQARTAVKENLDAPSVEAALLNDLGTIAWKRTEWSQAIRMYEQSLEMFDRVRDEHGMGIAWSNLANIYACKWEWDQAIRMYERSLEVKERIRDVHGMAQTWDNLGIVYANKGEWDQSIEYHERSLETFERVGDVHGMAQTYNNLGNVYRLQGEWDQAIEYHERSLEILEQVVDVHGMAATWVNLGNCYLRKAEWDRAIRMYERGLKMFKQVGDALGMATTWNDLGVVYGNKREWDKALEYHERSMKIFERVGDKHGMAQTWGNLGLMYVDKGEWEQAITMYERSLEMFERLGDQLGMDQTWGNLGNVYFKQGELDRAIGMYERSLETRVRVGDVHGMALMFNNLGLVYAGKEEWNRAIGMYERSLDTSERMGDVYGMAKTWINLGTTYSRMGKWDQATAMYERSLGAFERVGDEYSMAQTFNNLGNMYVDSGERDLAIAMYERSLETFKRVGDADRVAKTWGNLGSLYQEQGETEQAAKYAAHAYLMFKQIGAAQDAEYATVLLVKILGSIKEANAYLTELVS